MEQLAKKRKAEEEAEKAKSKRFRLSAAEIKKRQVCSNIK